MATSDATTKRRCTGRWRRLLQKLAAGAVISVFVECNPVPAPRPRVTRAGITYYPAPYPEYMGTLQRELSALRDGPPLEGNLVVGVEVIRPRPKKTKLATPRGDADNLAKGPLDAATKTKRFWHDDVQIETLFVTKRWAEGDEPAGVRLIVCPSQPADMET